jgi:hypothetical protein
MEMEMEMARTAADLSSTFEGHVLPGAIFMAWAIYWIAQSFGQGRPRGGTLEIGLVPPVAKVVLSLIGVWIEIPGRGWYPGDVVMSWQHVTMYSAFALSGVVDLLARRGVVSNSATYLAYAAAHVNAGLLFWGHSAHGGVEGLVHTLLAWTFFAVAGVTLAEMARPAAGLEWMRIGAQLVLGSWFILGGWILYQSGWDLSASFREGWSTLAFSWLVMGISVATVTLRILSRAVARA